MKVRDFLRHWSVGSNKNYPTFRLLTLVLSSIEEERRRSPQATLNTHPGKGIISLYENISVRFSFSVRLVNERCRSAVDVPWQRRAHRHLPGRRAARVPSPEVEICHGRGAPFRSERPAWLATEKSNLCRCVRRLSFQSHSGRWRSLFRQRR